VSSMASMDLWLSVAPLPCSRWGPFRFTAFLPPGCTRSTASTRMYGEDLHLRILDESRPWFLHCVFAAFLVLLARLALAVTLVYCSYAPSICRLVRSFCSHEEPNGLAPLRLTSRSKSRLCTLLRVAGCVVYLSASLPQPRSLLEVRRLALSF